MAPKPSIIIYGSETCSYCLAARTLLKKKGLDYEDILVSRDPSARADMIAKSGRSTVPQILINEQAIGGFDELSTLEQSGDLDRLLTQE